MFLARLVFGVAVIFAGYLSVNAAPVEPKDVQAGRVFRAEPHNFLPQSLGSHQGQGVAHPVVSLSNAEGNHAHVVATTSHYPYFPADMRDHVVPATHYTQHTGKQFHPNTHMAVGNPVHVHVDDLRRVGENAQIPHQLHHTDTENLMRDVYGDHHYRHVVAQQSPYNAHRAAHDAATHAGYHPPHSPNAQHDHTPQQHGQHPAPHWHPQQQHPYGHQPHGQHPAPHSQQQHPHGYHPHGQWHPAPHPQQQHPHGYQLHGQHPVPHPQQQHPHGYHPHGQWHPAPHPQQQHPHGYQPHGQHLALHPQQQHPHGYQPHGQWHPAPHPQQQHPHGYQPQGQQPQHHSQHPQGQHPQGQHPHGGHPPHH